MIVSVVSNANLTIFHRRINKNASDQLKSLVNVIQISAMTVVRRSSSPSMTFVLKNARLERLEKIKNFNVLPIRELDKRNMKMIWHTITSCIMN